MPVLVTSNFDDDSIKTERASMETPVSHCKSMGFIRRSRTANSAVSGPILPRGYKTFFMLNSAEHDIFPAKKSHNTNNHKFFLAKHS